MSHSGLIARTPFKVLFSKEMILTPSGSTKLNIIGTVPFIVKLTLPSLQTVKNNNKRYQLSYDKWNVTQQKELNEILRLRRFVEDMEYSIKTINPYTTENHFSAAVATKLVDAIRTVDAELTVITRDEVKLAGAKYEEHVSFPDFVICDIRAYRKLNSVINSGVLVIDLKPPRTMKYFNQTSNDELQNAINIQVQKVQNGDNVPVWFEGLIRSIVNAAMIGCSDVILTDLFTTVKIHLEYPIGTKLMKENDWSKLEVSICNIISLDNGYENYLQCIQSKPVRKKLGIEDKHFKRINDNIGETKVRCSHLIGNEINDVLMFIYNEAKVAQTDPNSWGKAMRLFYEKQIRTPKKGAKATTKTTTPTAKTTTPTEDEKEIERQAVLQQQQQQKQKKQKQKTPPIMDTIDPSTKPDTHDSDDDDAGAGGDGGTSGGGVGVTKRTITSGTKSGTGANKSPPEKSGKHTTTGHGHCVPNSFLVYHNHGEGRTQNVIQLYESDADPKDIKNIWFCKYVHVNDKKGIERLEHEYEIMEYIYNNGGSYLIPQNFELVNLKCAANLFPRDDICALITNDCGISLELLDDYNLNQAEIIADLRKKLKEIGVEHNDLFERNVIIEKNENNEKEKYNRFKVTVIDFEDAVVVGKESSQSPSIEI